MGYQHGNLERLCLSFLQLHPLGICHTRLSFKGCQHKPPRNIMQETVVQIDIHILSYACTIKDYWCAMAQSYHIASLWLKSGLSLNFQTLNTKNIYIQRVLVPDKFYGTTPCIYVLESINSMVANPPNAARMYIPPNITVSIPHPDECVICASGGHLFKIWEWNISKLGSYVNTIIIHMGVSLNGGTPKTPQKDNF